MSRTVTFLKPRVGEQPRRRRRARRSRVSRSRCDRRHSVRLNSSVAAVIATTEKIGRIQQVAGDRAEAGVLEQQALERVHGVGERIDDARSPASSRESPAADRRRRSGNTAACSARRRSRAARSGSLTRTISRNIMLISANAVTTITTNSAQQAQRIERIGNAGDERPDGHQHHAGEHRLDRARRG